jgi:rhamnosyltransferase
VKVSVAFLTKNPDRKFQTALERIKKQNFSPSDYEILIIDSSSNPPLEITQKLFSQLHVIPSEEFGHGKTRNLAAKLSQGEYIIFLTQDAIPSTKNWMRNLVYSVDEDDSIAGVFGRQIPYPGTNPCKTFFMRSRYGKKRYICKGGDISKPVFFSNVNSCIRRDILIQNPFDETLIMSEDFEWASRILGNTAYSIVYDPVASVFHSHNHSLISIFRRYFESGMSFGQINRLGTQSSPVSFGEGLNYVRKEFSHIWFNEDIKWIPFSLLYNFLKALGFYLGNKYLKIPRSLIRRLVYTKSFFQR